MPEKATDQLYESPEDVKPADVIGAQLRLQEKLMWAGRPPLRLLFRASDIWVVPDSLLVGALAAFVDASALHGPFFVPTAVTAILLTLLAFYVVFLRFFVDMAQRERIFYGVTSERVLIVWGVWRRQVKSIALETLGELSLTERRHGAGVIRFGWISVTPKFAVRVGGLPVTSPAVSAFELDADARQVYDLIRAARSQHGTADAACSAQAAR